MRLVYAIAIGIGLVWACAFAIVANEDAAISGNYAGADQFLSSVMK